MNSLIKVMATDMDIRPFTHESEESFCYRVLFSALGRWCLLLSYTDGDTGVSKRYQTLRLNEILSEYVKLSPVEKAFYIEDNNFTVFIRNVYEELGFFETLKNGYIQLRHNPYLVDLAETKLIIGYSFKAKSTGLGLQAQHNNETSISWREYLGRDNIRVNDYIDANYNIVRFEPKTIDRETLQFFNPIIDRAPSNSWQKTMATDKTIARCSEQGPYYYVVESDGETLFSEEIKSQTDESIDAFEYRKMYLALKQYYGYPTRATITRLDDHYSELIIRAHLPNREYYMLLQLCWPKDVFNNKYAFIIENDQLPAAKLLLTNIGINIQLGD